MYVQQKHSSHSHSFIPSIYYCHKEIHSQTSYYTTHCLVINPTSFTMEQQMKKQRELGLGQANSSHVMYEDFQPSADWTHDSNCHVLLIDLPGFKKEELKVQVDNSGKVTVSGERKLNESKSSRFKQVFDVPKDSDVDKVSGRLDGGLLFVIIPIKETAKAEEPKAENAKDIGKEEKKQETKSNNAEDLIKKHGHAVKKDIKERIDGIAAGLTGEKGNEEKKQDKSNKVENPIKKHEHGYDVQGVKKELKERIDGIAAGLTGEKGKKREREDWRKKLEKMREKEGLDGLMENAKEMISKNKTVIVTAVLAISVGLYISHRIRSGGR